uniref:Methyltransferase FkbM domain-containing protein n=1 Tax=viral metagenome TaxID=1070528 RepID=A0A6C0I068_9ZZZZ
MDKTYSQHVEWHSNNCDITHNLNHDLNENSIVFDIGGYTGKWTSQINDKFRSKIFIIEPILEFYRELENKFNHIENIKYKQVGIGVKNETCKINSINGDATQIIHSDDGDITIQLETLETIMTFFDVKNIDFLQINIEGAEYDILENWIETKIIEKINTIQIQFHQLSYIPNVVERRDKIRENLQKLGYKEKFNYQWVWECWTK